MARPTKQGLDYFPMDVGFLRDKKVNRLLTEFGASSVIFVLYVLGRVYEETGYYLKWDDDEVLIAAEAIRVKPQYIREVLAGCLKRSLFDSGVFQLFGALTSAGIQRRYIRGCEKRGEIRMAKEYWLLNVDLEKDVPPAARAKLCIFELEGGKNEVNSPENAVNSPESTQRRVKERKVDQRKGEERKPEHAPGARVISPAFLAFAKGNEPLLDALIGFEEMRTAGEAKLTERGRVLLLGDLERLSSKPEMQIKILNQSILKTWNGVYPLNAARKQAEPEVQSDPKLAQWVAESLAFRERCEQELAEKKQLEKEAGPS